MPQGRSGRTETEDESRVDHLLHLLSDLSPRDPSPDVRVRLEAIVAERLRDGARVRGADRTRLAWLKPAFAVVSLAAVGLAAGLVFHFRHHEPAQTGRTVKVSQPGLSPPTSQEKAARIDPAAAASPTRQARIQRPHSTLAQTSSIRRMIMQLPYSNSAIENGTYSIIRVSMSQSELLSLGFPINATLQDRRIAAELTLGEDGLPREISLPLPLEVMKEKR